MLLGLALAATVPVTTAVAPPAAAESGCSGLTTPVRQVVNPSTSASLLTRWQNEADSAARQFGFTQSLGVAFLAGAAPASGLTAVRRLYKASANDFVWSADPAEISGFQSRGYVAGGTEFYAPRSRTAACQVPVHRYQLGSKHRSAVAGSAAAGQLLAAGWRDAGTTWFGAPAGAAEPPTGTGGAGDLPSGPVGLDDSGKTIPANNYPVPAGAIIMSPNGNDGNNGSASAPVRTLNRAVRLASSGGTIVLRGGTYRDQYTNDGGITNKSLTLQAYPGESPWFDGSDPAPAAKWTASGSGRWTMPWSTPGFCEGAYYSAAPTGQRADNSGPCSHVDNAVGDRSNPLPADPQQVWAGGSALRQVGSAGDVAAGTFFYDWAARRLYIGVNPGSTTVEVAARPRALIVSRATFTIKGIGFRRYASNEYSNLTGAAVYLSNTKATLQNNAFTENSAAAVAVNNPVAGTVLSRNVFAYNGHTPLGANGNPSVRTDFRVLGNVFNRNDQALMGQHCRQSCNNAIGFKFSGLNGFSAIGNRVENSLGLANGLWCDPNCSNGIYTYNVVKNLSNAGIMHEVSNSAIVASNLIVDTKFGVNLSAANSKIYHNTIVSPKEQGLRIYDDSRSNAVGDYVGPNTTNVAVSGNVVVTTESQAAALAVFPGLPPNNKPNSAPSQYFSRLDGNLLAGPGTGATLVSWRPTVTVVPVIYRSADRAAFTAARGGMAAADIWADTSVTPVLQDIANGRYQLAQNAAGRGRAQPLPADVAAALGVATTLPKDLGAFAPPPN